MDLRGASAEAVVDLSRELGSVPSSDSARVGTELFAVAATVRSEGSLRRFATDASIATEARSGMVRQVFAGQVSEATIGLVSSAVARRWVVAGDLARGLEHLGVEASVRSAGDDSGRLSDELFAFAQAVKDNPPLRDALSEPARSTADKTTLVTDLLGGKALDATVALVIQALAGTHRTVGMALARYQQVAAEVHGEGVATVRVARPLSDPERERLSAALTQQYGRPVHLNMVIEPALLGGVRIEIGDDVIDGTVAARLDDARRRIAG